MFERSNFWRLLFGTKGTKPEAKPKRGQVLNREDRLEEKRLTFLKVSCDRFPTHLAICHLTRPQMIFLTCPPTIESDGCDLSLMEDFPRLYRRRARFLHRRAERARRRPRARAGKITPLFYRPRPRRRTRLLSSPGRASTTTTTSTSSEKSRRFFIVLVLVVLLDFFTASRPSTTTITSRRTRI